MNEAGFIKYVYSIEQLAEQDNVLRRRYCSSSDARPASASAPLSRPLNATQPASTSVSVATLPAATVRPASDSVCGLYSTNIPNDFWFLLDGSDSTAYFWCGAMAAFVDRFAEAIELSPESNQIPTLPRRWPTSPTETSRTVQCSTQRGFLRARSTMRSSTCTSKFSYALSWSPPPKKKREKKKEGCQEFNSRDQKRYWLNPLSCPLARSL